MQKPNPYAPPEASIDHVVPRPPVPKKPISVWVVQLLAALAAAVLMFFVSMILLMLWEGTATRLPALFRFGAVLQALALVLMLGTVIGIQRRANYGRGLGLASIASFFALLLYLQFFGVNARNSASSGRVDETPLFVLLLCLLAWCFYAFAFSAKVRQYFLNEHQ